LERHQGGQGDNGFSGVLKQNCKPYVCCECSVFG
jgi:hypothetical protein